jgi:hypothetical protein
MSTVLDAEFIRLATADGSIPGDDRVDADPYAIEESALRGLRRIIIIMRQRLASTRLSAERAATHREDAELRRNNKQARDLAAALRTFASARLASAAGSRMRAAAARDADARSRIRNPAGPPSEPPPPATAAPARPDVPA